MPRQNRGELETRYKTLAKTSRQGAVNSLHFHWNSVHPRSRQVLSFQILSLVSLTYNQPATKRRRNQPIILRAGAVRRHDVEV